MCPTIFQKIKFLPKVLWEHHSIQYFLHTIFFFSVTVLGPGRYPYQNLILYDQRSSSMILWKRGNFVESKLLWAYNNKNSKANSSKLKFDLTLQEDNLKSLKSCLQTVRDVTNNITQKLFFCQNSYEKTTRLKIFRVKNFEDHCNFTLVQTRAQRQIPPNQI